MLKETCVMSKRILVVEDDNAVRVLLCSMLRGSGWEVSPASNGREALECFYEAPPDIVLTDLMMPDMDGLEFLSALRSMDHSVPVVIYTGYPSMEKFHEAFFTGVTDFIVKPTESADLLRILENMLEKHRKISEERHNSVLH